MERKSLGQISVSIVEKNQIFVQNEGQKMIKTQTSVVNVAINWKMVHPFLLNKENGMLNVMKFLHVMINLQRTSESKMKTTSLPV